MADYTFWEWVISGSLMVLTIIGGILWMGWKRDE